MRLRAFAGAGVAALIGLTIAGTAQASPGYLNQGMNLRSGPGVDYPLIASLPPGTQAEIFGCLPEWSWCDVAIGDLRGWMAGVGLQVVYDDQPEPLVGYGAQIGLPFIGFDFGNYWGRYYRGRSWYSPVDRWHGGGPGGYGGPGRDQGGDRGGDFGPGHGGPGGFPGGFPGNRGPGGNPGGFPGNHGPDRGGPGPVQGPGGGGRGAPPGRAPQQAGPHEAPQGHGGPGGHEGGNRGPAPGGGHGGPDDHGPR